MKWLLGRVYHKNEHEVDVPGTFVLPVDRVIVRFLKSRIGAALKLAKAMPGAVNHVSFEVCQCSWHSAYSDWEGEDDWRLVEELPAEIAGEYKAGEEFHGVRGEALVVDRDGEIRFEAYEKYGGHEFETGVLFAAGLKGFLGIDVEKSKKAA